MRRRERAKQPPPRPRQKLTYTALSQVLPSCPCFDLVINQTFGSADRSQGRTMRAQLLSAVALLELLARAAPARIVAADVLTVGLHDRLRRAGSRGAAAGERHRRGRRAATTCSCDRVGACE